MLFVEKIGGTSMSRFENVLNNIIFNEQFYGEFPNYPYGRVIIVSAYGGVTNILLEDKKTGFPGIYKEILINNKEHLKQIEYDFRKDGKTKSSLSVIGNKFKESMMNLLKHLKKINNCFVNLNLDEDLANHFIENRVHAVIDIFQYMQGVLASGYIERRNILFAMKEILSSIGEAHSAFNSANIIKNNGLNSVFVDLSGLGDNRPLLINERIEEVLSTININKCIPIVTGYVRGVEGIMRQFDRGYSDVTLSKIAVALKADEAIIHKEFHLSSADPNVVGPENAIPVCYTNYKVADQLAEVGMEAIHSKAAKPLEKAGINIRVKNTFEPKHQGTLITKGYSSKQAKVEIVTGARDLFAIEILDNSMVLQVGFDKEFCGILSDFNISYISKFTSANSIAILIQSKDMNENMLEIFKTKYDTVNVEKVALVCVLGTNIAFPGILSKISTLLYKENINIKLVTHSLSQVNIQVAVDQKDYEKAICVLNQELCCNQLLKSSSIKKN